MSKTREEYVKAIKARRERKQKRYEEDEKRPHDFWEGGQPVPKLSDKTNYRIIQEIETKTVDDIKKEPLRLPKPYEWRELDVTNKKELDELHDLLENHYVEDDDATFRFAYTKEFLEWALCPPGWNKLFHLKLGFTNKKGEFRMVGFVSGIPCKVSVSGENTKVLPMVEINFLCVLNKLRGRKMAQVLIKEITRRVNTTGVFQAIYTAGRKIPRPMSTTKYYHRSLNPEKLISIKFSTVPKKFRGKKDEMKRTIRHFSFPSKFKLEGWRKMKKEDIDQVHELYSNFIKKFKVHIEMDKEEAAHWLLPRDGVISSFVLEDPKTNKITDFGCYYHLPSSIINHKKYKVLKAAYLFYYANTKEKLEKIITALCIEAKKEGFDVFNCLNILNNSKFLTELKFHVGDGFLFYYLFNLKTPIYHPDEIGVTML